MAAANAGATDPAPRPRLSFDGVPALAAPVAERVAARLAARGATPLDWSPRGELLVATRLGETTQLHLLDSALGERRQLTFYREPLAAGAFATDAWHDWLVYSTRADEAGQARLWLQNATGGPAHALTDGTREATAPVWSNDGRSIAYALAEAQGRGSDVAVLSIGGVSPAAAGSKAPTWPSSSSRIVLAAQGAFARPLDWSPDDRRLLVRERLENGEQRLDALALDGGERRTIAPPATGAITEARFSRDGRGVYLISAREGEFRQLVYVGLFDGAERRVSAADAGDVEDFALSRDGRYLAYTELRGGYDRLHLLDLSAAHELPVAPLPAPGAIAALHFDLAGHRLAFAYSNPRQPRDAYVLDLGTGRLQPWTRSEPGDADPRGFVQPLTLQAPTFDRGDGGQRELPVHAYLPPGGTRHPVLILFHSRPDQAFHARFDPWIQYVVGELGYAVLVPDLRGSLGEGRSFAALDDRLQRGDVVKDIGALLVWLEGRPELDAHHVVVAGRAYGGYLALLAAANYSDRLTGLVDWSGITDLPTWLDALPPSRRPAARLEFGDERDPGVRAFLRNLSPIALADRITTPALILHGRRDTRVPFTQGEEMTYLLRGRHVPVWWIVANREGHRFAAQSDRVEAYTAFAQFLTDRR